ncbi:hypothetical protein ADL21_07705 [Streptomyces albus subsp. albus]|nr:hypothetical protein ADL21_07705 [Streptomyces albus subsp. albus]
MAVDGAPVEEAVAKVRAAHEGPGGGYGQQGLYRVVAVTEEDTRSVTENPAGKREEREEK